MGELGQSGVTPRVGRLPTGDDELDEFLRKWDRGHLRGEAPEPELDTEILKKAREGKWKFLDEFDAATGYEASAVFEDYYNLRPKD